MDVSALPSPTRTSQEHPALPARRARSRPDLLVRAGLVVLVGMVAALLASGISSPDPQTTGSAPAASIEAQAAVGTQPPGTPTTATTAAGPRASASLTTASTFPLPEALPADPYAITPIEQVGVISIPKLGVTATIYEGMTLSVINLGAGHWPGTAKPGAQGNMVIAGHRTTYQKPFNRLNELVEGDKVTVSSTAGVFTYEVRGVVVVDGRAIDIAEPNGAHTATLFACHPPGSAAQRIVAKLRLLDSAGRPVDPDSALPPVSLGTGPGAHTLAVRPPSTQPGQAAPSSPATMPAQ